MKKIILASHGGLAAGLVDTVQMVLGDVSNLYAVMTTRNESESILVSARRLLDSFDSEHQVYILTDILGGSVNNDMLTLLRDYPNLQIICGFNLSLVLQLMMSPEPLEEKTLAVLIQQSKEQIINCTKMIKQSEEEEDDL